MRNQGRITRRKTPPDYGLAGRKGSGQIVTHGLATGRRLAGAAAKTRRRRWPLVLCGLFFAFLATATLGGKFPPVLAGLYTAASLITFGTYAADKSAARNGRRRTQENTLHLLALFGGWPGALLAQHRLRHKSAKPSFLIVFWATVLLNCGGLGLFLTSTGSLSPSTLLGN